MPRKTRLLIEFDTPRGVPHAELRTFIIECLEGYGKSGVRDGLKDVKVSKPIVPWREPPAFAHSLTKTPPI